jgi:serine/threonine protein kinase
MLALLSCPQGHFWEAVNGEDGASPNRPVCPVCGAAAEAIPLLDLAPSDPPPAKTAPAPPSPPPLRDDKGRPVVAGYEVIEELGRGPTGVAFYRARQVLVNRPVLLKVVYAREDTGQVAWGSLRGEASALGRLAHPNIVQVFEAGERDRQLFYNAVEFVDGPTLAALAADKVLNARQAVLLVETLARAVHHAHEKGVVHRNLKPASILLQEVHRDYPKKNLEPLSGPPYCEMQSTLYLPKITDWGLARRPVEGDVNDAELQGEQPYYLSPEQAWGRAKEIGPPADVYALGAILYELLAGRPPFREATPSQTLDAIQCREPPRGEGLSRDLAAICRRCLAKQPGRRYGSARALAEDLRRWLTHQRVLARPPSMGYGLGRWLRRHVHGIAAFGVSMLICACVMGLFLSSPRVSPTTAPQRYASRLQQDLAQLRASRDQAQQREQEARYFQRIALAERALGDRNPEQAREVLDGCPDNQRRWEWYFLKRQTGGPNTAQVFAGPTRVTHVAFSPGSQSLALCGEEDLAGNGQVGGEASVWRLTVKVRDQWIANPAGPVRRVAWSPDGFRLAVLLDEAQGTELRFVDARTGRRVSSHRFRGARATDVAYSPDGSRLLLTDAGGTLRLLLASTSGELWSRNLNARQPWVRLQGPYARAVALNPDASRFAAVTADGRQLLLGSAWQEQVSELEGHPDVVLALAAHSATERLATGGRDLVARVWNTAGGVRPLELHGHRSAVTGVAWSADGSRLATCSLDGTAKVWDPASGLEVLTLKGFDGEPRAIAFSPDGSRLAVAHGGKVTVWMGETIPDMKFGDFRH